jgi:dihydrodiol dehydrogenase / D-xylose 1-dehydrogenase (NADP)
MMKYGWGILGPGNIARRFMNDLPLCPQADLAAVASRSPEKARAFAEQYGFAKSYGSYRDLLEDPTVDIVYIAVPHTLHQELTIQALEAGKAVLCEKPAAVNALQLQAMIDCARDRRRFFMEAMWTRFFPVNQRVYQIISSDALGTVTLIEADLGFGNWSGGRVANPQSRLFSPELAGGSLLDLGVYCVSYLTRMKGAYPVAIKALGARTETDVDGMTAAIFHYSDGTVAVLRSSVIQTMRQTAIIYCEKATIEVPDFFHPSRAVIRYAEKGHPDEIIEIPYQVDGTTGFNFEAEAVMACLDRGLLECPDMTWQQSLEVMELLDAIRREIGLKYPFE